MGKERRDMGLAAVEPAGIVRFKNGRIATVSGRAANDDMTVMYANGEVEQLNPWDYAITLVYTPVEASLEVLKQFAVNDARVAKTTAEAIARETRHTSYIDKHSGITLEEWLRVTRGSEPRGLEQRTYYEVAKALPDFEEAGVNNPDLLINQAWSRGHSSGLQEVLIELDELLDLFRGQ